MRIIKYLLLFFCAIGIQAYGQNNVLKNTHKGNVFYMNGAYKDAVASYDKAITEAPFNFKANFNVGNAYFRLEDYDKALTKYEAIVDHGKTNAQKAAVNHNIGNCYMMKGEFKAAINAYQNSLRLNPFDESTRYNLAYALLKQKEKEQQEQQKDDQNKEKQDKDDKENQDKENQDKDDQNKDDQNKEKDDGDGNEGDSDEEKDQNEKDKQNEERDEKDNEEPEKGNQDQKPTPKTTLRSSSKKRKRNSRQKGPKS